MVKRYTYWVLKNLTSDNRNWKIPVIIRPYLKHEIIFGLNFLKTSNAIIIFTDNDVNFGTDIKIPVIYTSPFALTFKHLFYRYELICNRQTILVFIITSIIQVNMTAVSFKLHCSENWASHEHNLCQSYSIWNDEITWDDLITSTTYSSLRVHSLLSQFTQKPDKQLLVLQWSIPKVPSTTLNATRRATLCISPNNLTVLK